MQDAQDKDGENIEAVAFSCFIQVIAFTLNECVMLGLMKDVPQELTIAFNVGKGCGSFLFVLCWVTLAQYGQDSVMFWFFTATLPVPIY